MLIGRGWGIRKRPRRGHVDLNIALINTDCVRVRFSPSEISESAVASLLKSGICQSHRNRGQWLLVPEIEVIDVDNVIPVNVQECGFAIPALANHGKQFILCSSTTGGNGCA